MKSFLPGKKRLKEKNILINNLDEQNKKNKKLNEEKQLEIIHKRKEIDDLNKKL